MSTPTLISDEHITSTPDSDTIKNVRPGSGSKWEEDADKEPTITVTLVDEDEDPVPIGVIKVTGNVPSFTVLYQTADDELTPVTKPGSKEPQVNPFALELGGQAIFGWCNPGPRTGTACKHLAHQSYPASNYGSSSNVSHAYGCLFYLSNRSLTKPIKKARSRLPSVLSPRRSSLCPLSPPMMTRL